MPAPVYVIVARLLHAQPGWSGPQDWTPVGYAPSLEEAWAALDLAKENERQRLTAVAEEHPHEREYDVWTVPSWETIETARD